MDYSDGEIVLQCPNKHPLGFIVVPSRYNVHVDRLGLVDRRIGQGENVPFRPVPPGYPLRETCRVCKGNGRKYDYAAPWTEVRECLVKLRDTPSITLTLT
jgi:hypothetical protein